MVELGVRFDVSGAEVERLRLGGGLVERKSERALCGRIPRFISIKFRRIILNCNFQ